MNHSNILVGTLLRGDDRVLGRFLNEIYHEFSGLTLCSSSAQVYFAFVLWIHPFSKWRTNRLYNIVRNFLNLLYWKIYEAKKGEKLVAFLPLFYQIFVLFMLIMIGFIIYRLQIVNDQMVTDLTRLILDVTLPALILISMNFEFSSEILQESILLFLISLAIYLGSWVFGVGATRLIKGSIKWKAVYQFMLVFPNIGFMGYPVIAAVFGKLGVFYTSVFNLTFGLMVWTLGVWIYQRGTNEGKFNFRWRSLMTPGIVATVVGFILFLISFDFPEPIFKTLEMLGGITTPLSMITVGAMLGRSSLRTIWGTFSIYLFSFFRLLVLPVLVLLIMLPFGFSEIMLGTSVVLVGMPAAANTAMFASRYNGDADLASRVVFLSTLFSIITIPGLVFLIRIFYS